MSNLEPADDDPEGVLLADEFDAAGDLEQQQAPEGSSRAAAEMLHATTARFWRLARWENPRTTGVVFTAVNLFFIVIYWLKYTVLGLCAYVVLCAIAASVLFHSLNWLYFKATGNRMSLKSNLQQYTRIDFSPVESVLNYEEAGKPIPLDINAAEYITPIAGAIEGAFNVIMSAIVNAVMLRNLRGTAQTTAIAVVLVQLGRDYDAADLFYSAFVLVFTLPKLSMMLWAKPEVREQLLIGTQRAMTIAGDIRQKASQTLEHAGIHRRVSGSTPRAPASPSSPHH